MSVFTNASSGSVDQAAAYVTAVIDLLGTTDPMVVLRSTPSALANVLTGLSNGQIGQREREGKWSIRQVVQHLADSELVWGYRVRMVLAHDRPPLTGYDQDLWADRLHYDRSDATEAVRDFATLRASNLRLLGGATEKELARVGVHAERGEEGLTHMIRLYAGHDLLHLQQLDRIRATVTTSN